MILVIPASRVDRRYAPLWARCGGAAGPLAAAGWFDDGLADPDRDALMKTDLLTTPVSKLTLSADRENLVLVAMGSFAPVHAGHLAMMDAARDALIAQGHHVAGGYFSPSHDGYVLTKPGVTMGISARLDALHVATRHSWAGVDPWEGLWVNRALNLTTVLDRTEAYLARHLPGHAFTAVAVFGSDNVGFADAFLEEGRFVCVSRDPQHDLRQWAESGYTPRGVFVWGRENPLSSTKVRAALGSGDAPVSCVPGGTLYVLRDDLRLTAPVPVKDADSADLARILEDHAGLRVVQIRTEDQIARARREIRGPVVSLDVHFPGNVRMDLTRLFEISDPQHAPTRLITRGTAALIGVPAPLPHVLVDDDRASGFTLRRAREILDEAGIRVAGEAFLNDAYVSPDSVHDVVDARDFLIFARHGGLTVRTPVHGVARAPYWAPFVDLSARAKIPRREHLRMTRRLLEWNRAIFARSEPFRVADAEDRQRRWAATCGFTEADTALDLIVWMLRMTESAA